jgi:hypothetical protein
MIQGIMYTPELAERWKNAMREANKAPDYVFDRFITSFSKSQLESKLEMIDLMLDCGLKPKRVALIAGWFGTYSVPLLFDNFPSIEYIENFEIDPTLKKISYKLHRNYKNNDQYKFSRKNAMLDKLVSDEDEQFDLVINTSCEHMYYMSHFRKINPYFRGWYVLQSNNDGSYDDHINPVNSASELAEQANIFQPDASSQKKLSNGMERYTVIGR